MDPLANAMEQCMRKRMTIFSCIRCVLVNHVAGKPTLLAVDAGRKLLSLESKPTFATLEGWVNAMNETTE